MDEETRVTHILDAGPLIAALNRDDHHHRWARETLARLGPPFHTCPEAMAEAAAMTGRPAAIVEMIHAGEVALSFDLAEQAAAVLVLLKKYADREMDLADACIVRMTEVVRECRVVTLDRSDFSVIGATAATSFPLSRRPPNASEAPAPDRRACRAVQALVGQRRSQRYPDRMGLVDQAPFHRRSTI